MSNKSYEKEIIAIGVIGSAVLWAKQKGFFEKKEQGGIIDNILDTGESVTGTFVRTADWWAKFLDPNTKFFNNNNNRLDVPTGYEQIWAIKNTPNINTSQLLSLVDSASIVPRENIFSTNTNTNTNSINSDNKINDVKNNSKSKKSYAIANLKSSDGSINQKIAIVPSGTSEQKTIALTPKITTKEVTKAIDSLSTVKWSF